MWLSGFLPVVGRRVVVALGVAVMMMVAASAQAQTDPPAAAAAQPEAPDTLKFASASPVMLLLSIKPGQEATFEQGFAEMRAGLAAAKPEHQAQAKSMQLMKVDLAAAGQPVIYILFLDPPVTDLSYDLTKIHYYGGAFDVSTVEARKKVDDLYAKFTASLAGVNAWPIVKK
jgi:hypothetical protein